MIYTYLIKKTLTSYITEEMLHFSSLTFIILCFSVFSRECSAHGNADHAQNKNKTKYVFHFPLSV